MVSDASDTSCTTWPVSTIGSKEGREEERETAQGAVRRYRCSSGFSRGEDVSVSRVCSVYGCAIGEPGGAATARRAGAPRATLVCCCPWCPRVGPWLAMEVEKDNPPFLRSCWLLTGQQRPLRGQSRSVLFRRTGCWGCMQGGGSGYGEAGGAVGGRGGVGGGGGGRGAPGAGAGGARGGD